MSDESQSNSPTSLLNSMPQHLNTTMSMSNAVDAARHSLITNQQQSPSSHSTTSLLSVIMQQSQQPNISTTSFTTSNSDAFTAFAKSKLLGDFLANQLTNSNNNSVSINPLAPATSNASNQNSGFSGVLNPLPLAKKMATLSHILGNSGLIQSTTETSINDLIINLFSNPSSLSGIANQLGLSNSSTMTNELQRIQLIQLYAHQQHQQQQNLLQQILLGNLSGSNPHSALNTEQLFLGHNLQEPNNSLNEQNTTLLAQLLIAKLANNQVTTEQQLQHKLNSITSPMDYVITQQKNVVSPVQIHTPTLVSQETAYKPSSSNGLQNHLIDSSKMTSLLEEYILKNQLTSCKENKTTTSIETKMKKDLCVTSNESNSTRMSPVKNTDSNSDSSSMLVV